MGFNYNADGIEINTGSWEPMPEGDYTLKVISVEEKESKNGDPMVQLDAAVVEPAKYKESEVRHWVTFFKDKSNKGAGIAIQFLKLINQPWEGKIEVSPKAWIGKRFRAHVTIETYLSSKDNQEKKSNKIKYLLDRDHVAEKEAAVDEEAPPIVDEVPF